MAANRLQFETSLDGTGFARGLGSLGNNLKSVIAGAFTVTAITQAVKGTIDWASRLADVADNLQVNVEWLQKLGNAANLAGSNIGDVEKFLAAMTNTRQQAITNPTGEAARAYSNLGISPGQISGLSTQAMMDEISRQFASGAGSIADLSAVGGRSARKLAEAFRTQFANDIPIVSAALIYELDALGDRFTVLSTSIKATLAPAIIAVMNAIRGFVNWLKELGSFLGGFFANLPGNINENASGQSGWRETVKGIGDGIVESFTEGGQAADDEAKRQAKEKADTDAALAAAAAARNKATGEAPNFAELVDKTAKEKTIKTAAPASDALVAVGNFLGSGSGLINSISQQQLTEAKLTNTKLDAHGKTLNKIADKLTTTAGSDDGIEVPP